MTKAYKMLEDSKLEPKVVKGTTVFKCLKHDYGCANDDTRNTGIRHISLTLNSSGDYPFFTAPESAIEALP